MSELIEEVYTDGYLAVSDDCMNVRVECMTLHCSTQMLATRGRRCASMRQESTSSTHHVLRAIAGGGDVIRTPFGTGSGVCLTLTLLLDVEAVSLLR